MLPDERPSTRVATEPRWAQRVTAYMGGIVLLAALVVLSQVNYLLFHSLIEIVVVAVAVGLFLLVWAGRRFIVNQALLILGVCFLFVGLLELLHVLTYRGMNFFPAAEIGNVPTQLWIAARLLTSTALLLFALSLRRPASLAVVWTIFGGSALLAYVTIFVFPVFPDCYSPETGLTSVKLVLEAVIIGLFLCAAGILAVERRALPAAVYHSLMWAIGASVTVEVAFCFNIGVYDLSNMLGHLLLLISSFLFYRALILASLTSPLEMLFRRWDRESTRHRRTAFLYQSLFENMRQGVIYRDATGRIEHLNPAASRLMGLTREQLTEEAPLPTGWRAEREDGSELAWDEWPGLIALRTGGPISGTRLKFRHADGHLVWASFDATPEFADGGPTPSGCHVVLTDDTARVTAEHALRQREELFRTAFENHSAPKLLIDATTGRIVEANRAAVAFYGWERDTLLEMSIQDIDTLPASEVMRHVERVRAHSRSRSESEHRRADGSVRDVEVFSSSITAGGCEVVYAIIHDITDQVRAEQALRDREAWLNQLTEGLPTLVWAARPDGTLEYLTRRWAEYTDVPRKMLLHYGHLQVVHPEDRETMHRAWQDALKNGLPTTVEARLRRHDGSYRWFSIRAVPARDEDGSIVRWFGVDTEITEVKRAQEALERRARLQDRIQQSQKLYIGEGDYRSSMGLVLVAALEASDSPQGFIAEVLSEPRGVAQTGPQLRKVVCKCTQDCGRCLDTSLTALPGDPPDDSICIQLRFGSVTMGLLQMKVGESGSRVDLPAFLEPLASAAAAIIRDHELSRREREAVEQLQKRERDYRRLFETMEQGVIYQDRAGLILSANPAAERILGVSLSDMQSLPWKAENWPAVDQDLKPFPFERLPSVMALRSGRPVGNVVLGIRTGNESARWLLVGAIPERRPGEDYPWRVFSIFSDITERQEAEARLRQTSNRLQYALDATSEGVWDWNVVTGQVFLSDNCTQSLGYTPQEAGNDIGFWQRIIHPEDVRRTLSDLSAHLRGETEVFESETRLRMKSGQYRDTLLQGKVVETDEHGSPLRMVGVEVDVTERNRAHEQLRQLSQSLARAQEAERARVAAELHDEIGQALTALTLLLEDRPGLNPDVFTRRVQQGRTVAGELLSKVRQMTLDLRPPLLDDLGLGHALEALVDRHRHTTGMAASLAQQGDVPPLPSHMAVSIYRIVQEALTNVARHAEATEVAISLAVDDEGITVEISDDGKGFDFAPQSESSMGLTGMKERARAMRGVLEVQSASGAGTTVKALLPLPEGEGE